MEPEEKGLSCLITTVLVRLAFFIVGPIQSKPLLGVAMKCPAHSKDSCHYSGPCGGPIRGLFSRRMACARASAIRQWSLNGGEDKGDTNDAFLGGTIYIMPSMHAQARRDRMMNAYK